MTPVVCLAHGSRHPDADAAVARIADAVARITGAPAHPAYLDFSPLTLTTVARLIRAEGHDRATVVPMLFTRAFHLRHDVPAALAEATARTGVGFRLAEGVGTGEDVAALLASRIPSGTGHLVLYSVGSTVAGANETVARLAVRVGELAGLPAGRASLVTATGPGNTGPEALCSAVRAAVNAAAEDAAGTSVTVHVAPLFISPGTLWDAALGVLRGTRHGLPVTTGVPLDTAVAPLTAERTRPGFRESQERTRQ